jgi:serine protease AprX
MRERDESRPDVAGHEVVARDLFDPQERRANKLPTSDDEPLPVVIELNVDHVKGAAGARLRFLRLYEEETRGAPRREPPVELTNAYLRCWVTTTEINRLVRRDREARHLDRRAIEHVWMDYLVRRLIDRSASTIKADAARFLYDATGEGIVWAVLDSGIDASHPHFRTYETLSGEVAAWHRDFTGLFQPLDVFSDSVRDAALVDQAGHGTHVAGIIAGVLPRAVSGKRTAPHRVARHVPVSDMLQKGGTSDLYRIKSLEHAIEEFTEVEDVEIRRLKEPERLSGIAPKVKLVSLKVLDENGEGRTSNVIIALRYVRDVVNSGLVPRIHGANLSLGYPYNAKAFACGHSPLCLEVDRLVRSGVVVVTAAGNSGYGEVAARSGHLDTGLALTINDPGNAARAITVGATHRDSPHTYGASYFSSKGPTADGRLKPDLVAPGERITSCATGQMLDEVRDAVMAGWQPPPDAAYYVDSSGTSMAAPHVSGAIAAFLSVHREFIGRPEDVKRIFLESATSLGREAHFQGRGLVDLVRALNAV